jgi:cytochrome c biogenesis protein CcmG, thiol:disulfide interchange protein DsbE
MTMRSSAMRGGWAIVSAAMAVALAVSTPAIARDPKVGDVAPDAEIKLVNGETVHLSDLRGQVVVLNFWATWCGPCKAELPTLDSYYRIQRASGLRVFAATTEDSLPDSALHKLFSLLAIDPVRRLKGPYHPLEGVPTNYVIDRKGVIRYARTAAFDLDSLNAVLVPLLREPAPAPAPQTAMR